MTRRLFAFEKGMRIYKENDDTQFIDFLFGSAAPGGDTGEQDDAPIGSLYLRQNGASSTLYQKIADTNATSDWQENGSTSLQLGFRPEKVRAVTSENVSPGVRNLTTTPFTDDDGTTLDASDFAVGEFVIVNSGGVAVLLEVTAVSAPNVTFSTPGSAPVLAEFDTFLTPNYLPDPDGQENQALVQINGSGSVVKVADVDWEFATGINLSGGYAAASGNITTADTVESAIQKLDGVNDAQDLVLGTSQGATNLGSFTGDLITDNNDVKGALQELEEAAENYKQTQTGVASATVLDSVLVDDYRSCIWLVSSFDEANPADSKSALIHAKNNGTSSADATSVDDTDFAKLFTPGGNYNSQISVVLNGTGAAQEMRLQVNSTEPGVTFTAVRLGATPSGY